MKTPAQIIKPILNKLNIPAVRYEKFYDDNNGWGAHCGNQWGNYYVYYQVTKEGYTWRGGVYGRRTCLAIETKDGFDKKNWLDQIENELQNNDIQYERKHNWVNIKLNK